MSSRSGPPDELRVLDVSTGTVTLLTEGERSEEGLSVIDFSPEGDRILFSRTEAWQNFLVSAEVKGGGPSSLWSVNADGSDPRRLASGTDWGDWWSPSQTR